MPKRCGDCTPRMPAGADVDGLLFVNGTLMRGLELHENLAGAEFLEQTTTAPRYRVRSIDDVHPGMYEVGAGEVALPSPESSTECRRTSSNGSSTASRTGCTGDRSS